MQEVHLTKLQPGMTFEGHLYTAGGQKLLAAGTALDEQRLEAIRRGGDVRFYIANDMRELAEAGVIHVYDPQQLAIGTTSSRHVLSSRGRVVVEAGDKIEKHHLEALRTAGSSFVAVSDSAPSLRERMLQADSLVQEILRASRTVQLHVEPNPDDSIYTTEPADATAWPDAHELTDIRYVHVEVIREMYARIEAGIDVSILQFGEIIDALLPLMQRHPTRFAQLALLSSRRSDYLPDHAFTVTVLAMAAAWQMRWRESAIRELGITTLLFDVGMLMVPQRVRVGNETLSDLDLGRVQRHPVFSLALLQHVEGVPFMTQLAALQHHEREHGLGYPHNLKPEQVCDYAKLIAVCDTFAAATEPRPYRKPKLPHEAMVEMLRESSAHHLDHTFCRAMIHAVGLHPVGSFVRLSNGHNGAVIETNANAIERPTVQELDTNGHPTGRVLDLADQENEGIRILEPIRTATG